MELLRPRMQKCDSITNRSRDERALLQSIGYEAEGTNMKMDIESWCKWRGVIHRVKTMIQCQKEERRKYHRRNELHMKQLLYEAIKKEFGARGEVEVVVGGEKEDVVLPIEDRIVDFEKFCSTAASNVGTRLLLEQLLQFFEKQLYCANICE